MIKFEIRSINYLITAESVQKMAWENSDNFDGKGFILICPCGMNIKRVVTIDSLCGTKNGWPLFLQSLHDN